MKNQNQNQYQPKKGANEHQNQQEGHHANDDTSSYKTDQIFVGGCNPKTKKGDLMSYFSKYGELIECRLMTDKTTKKFRGFAFIQYSTEEATQKVLSIHNHIILEKKLDLKRAMTKENTRSKLIDEKYRKMFLYGLKKVITQDDLEQYFRRWGEIDECKVYFEATGKKGGYKGFGFIVFIEKDTMQQVLDESEFHTIKDVTFECKPILLKDELLKVKETKNPQQKKLAGQSEAFNHHQEYSHCEDESSISFNSQSHQHRGYYQPDTYPNQGNHARSSYSGYSGGYQQYNYPPQSYGNQGYDYPIYGSYGAQSPHYLPAITPPGHPHTELDIKTVANQKEQRDQAVKAQKPKNKKSDTPQGQPPAQNYKVTNLSNTSHISQPYSNDTRALPSTHYSISTNKESYHYGPNSQYGNYPPRPHSYVAQGHQKGFHQYPQVNYGPERAPINESPVQPSQHWQLGRHNQQAPHPRHPYSVYGYPHGPAQIKQKLGPGTHYHVDSIQDDISNSHHFTEAPRNAGRAVRGLEAKSEFVQPRKTLEQNEKIPVQEPQTLFEKAIPNFEAINHMIEINGKKANTIDLEELNTKWGDEMLEMVYEDDSELDSTPHKVQNNTGDNSQQTKPKEIFSKFTGMKYSNFQAESKNDFNATDQPLPDHVQNSLQMIFSSNSNTTPTTDPNEQQTSEHANRNQASHQNAHIEDNNSEYNALEGFQPQRDLAHETMSVVFEEHQRHQDFYAAKSVNFNLKEFNQKNSESTLDLTQIEQFQSQNLKRLSEISKKKSNEESSVHARDTDDILKFSQNDTRELFDVDNQLGNITELCDAEELSFQRDLKSGTFQSKKSKNLYSKNKTDGFIIAKVNSEDEDDDQEDTIQNMNLLKRPERGGSHNFNIYSDKKGKEGDFDLKKIQEVESVKEQSLHDLKFSDDDSDDSDDGDRRRAGEVDYDF